MESSQSCAQSPAFSSGCKLHHDQLTPPSPEALGEHQICPRDQNSAARKGQGMEDPPLSHLVQHSAWEEVAEPQHQDQQEDFA